MRVDRGSRVVSLIVAAWVGVCLWSAPALGQSLQSRLEAVLRTADTGGAKCAFHVIDLADGLTVAEMNSDSAMIPASNMKLVTTAAGLMLFDKDFAFSTQLVRRGDDLIIVGDGDPAFGDPKILRTMNMNVEDLLARWVDAAKRAGVKRIRTLVIDDRALDGEYIHPHWPKDQLEHWYCAPVAGINFNDNCLDIYATPRKYGQAPIIRTQPTDAPVVMTNRARTGGRNAVWATREPGTNQITFRGTLKHRLTAPIYITIHDPPMLFARTLRDRLETGGITVGQVARIDSGASLEDVQLIAEVRTPIDEVLKRCNKDSQNLFAEALVKRIGLKATGEPGSWSSGTAAVRMFLSRFLGSEAAQFVIDDGSGLSQHNRIPPAMMTQLLNRMHHLDADIAETFRRSLSVAGEDGTLRRRLPRGMTGTVYGKSGYIKGVVALSGYVMQEDGKAFAFSIMLNEFNKPSFQGKRIIDRMVRAIDDYMAGVPADRDTGDAAEDADDGGAADAGDSSDHD